MYVFKIFVNLAVVYMACSVFEEVCAGDKGILLHQIVLFYIK